MFTQPCFIRKNSKYLRDKLEEFGYTHPYNYGNDDYYDFILCFKGCYYLLSQNAYVIREGHPLKKRGSVDCGTNEDLFLAIAAMRDDTDKNQWFASNYFDKDMNPDEFVKCNVDNYKEFFGDCPYVRNYDDFHKATVEELIEHFK